MDAADEVTDRRELQAAQLSVALESRLSNTAMWFREVAAAPELLAPDETVLDVFSSYWGRISMSAGLLLETSERLLFISFGFLRRRPVVRTVRFDEIKSGVADFSLGVPGLVLTLRTGRNLRLQGTRPDREAFSDLIRSLKRRLPTQLDTSRLPKDANGETRDS